MSDYSVISQGLPAIDAKAKVTGQTEYISDIRLPGMLWGQVLRSPYPHARIKNIDVTAAAKVPGVKAVITAQDIPHIPHGPFMPDWETLAREKVTFVGQEVAAVAALTPEAAWKAVQLIKVDYEE